MTTASFAVCDGRIFNGTAVLDAYALLQEDLKLFATFIDGSCAYGGASRQGAIA